MRNLGKTYVCTVDVARGTTNDYSAFVMLDCSQVPYRVVAKYRNNEIKPFVFPNIIHQVCTYNKAHVLVEVNDLGQQIADTLQYETEYEKSVNDNSKRRSCRSSIGRFFWWGSSLGVRMTKSIKKLGCSNIKTLIESDKILINDFNIIEEMSTFSKEVLHGRQKTEQMMT